MMKTIISILTITIFLGCSPHERKIDDNLLQFNQYLGVEKAQVLDKTVASFHDFLDSNYPGEKNLSDQTLAFIKELDSLYHKDSAYKWLNPNWKIDDVFNEEIIRDWEKTELRREVWLYGLELRAEGRGEMKYADTSIYSESERKKQALRDSSLFFNADGDWISGLQNSAVNDPYMKEYVDMQLLMPLSPAALIPSFIENEVNLKNPFIQRVIVTELFMPVIDKDLERKKRKTTRQQWLRKHAGSH